MKLNPQDFVNPTPDMECELVRDKVENLRDCEWSFAGLLDDEGDEESENNEEPKDSEDDYERETAWWEQLREFGGES